MICSITATVYYGGLCTQKYISDPVTVVDEIVPLESLPPLKWSVCKQVTLTDCSFQEYYDFWSGSITTSTGQNNIDYLTLSSSYISGAISQTFV